MNRERVKIAQDVAAALAHELRNPVFAIASAAQLLRYRVTDDPVIEKNIGRIMRETERLNALVSALLEYGRLDRVDADDFMEEVDQVLWALQSLDVAVQDDAIPAGVGELDSVAQEL